MESTLTGDTTAAASTTAVGSAAVAKKMKIMVAIDESDGSFYALKWALDFLLGGLPTAPPPTTTGMMGSSDDQMNREEFAMVYLVHVNQPFHNFVYPAGPGFGTAVYATSSMMESVRKAQEENSDALLSRALQVCKDKMVKAESLILQGDPKDMICQVAEQTHADLLVVGSRGLGQIKRAFLGSVSDYCSHHAKCPILIVKPPPPPKDAKKPKEPKHEPKHEQKHEPKLEPKLEPKHESKHE